MNTNDAINQAIYTGRLDDIQHPGFIVELPAAVAKREGFDADDTISVADALDGQEVPVWPTKS